MKANIVIREALVKCGVRQWELAEKFGLSPNYFVTKMRHDFTEEETLKALSYIGQIQEEHEREVNENEKDQ